MRPFRRSPLRGIHRAQQVLEISLTFSEPVQPLSITAPTVNLTRGQTAIPATLTSDAATPELVIKPTARPDPLTGAITITAEGVKDIAGNALAKTTSSFTAPEWQAPGGELGSGALNVDTHNTIGAGLPSITLQANGDPMVACSDVKFAANVGTAVCGRSSAHSTWTPTSLRTSTAR